MALYPLLVLARVFNLLFGRDPLRLREPKGASCWIQREAESSVTAYFSESSSLEGKHHGGFGRLATHVLERVARAFAPAHSKPHASFRAATHRDQNIPDEVYTLW